MSKKIIVTTTINAPTDALIKFSQLGDWDLVVVGDRRTPHSEYTQNSRIIYLSPEDQEKIEPQLSKLIGWDCVQRRNLGFYFALKEGYEIIATIDDDNIPSEEWGSDIVVGYNTDVTVYYPDRDFFDPLFVTNHPELWHRGFPIQHVHDRSQGCSAVSKVNCVVQAALWTGDPDIDAICRMIAAPQIDKFEHVSYFSSPAFSPFNSQNTILHRSVLPDYMMLPFIGRMDDIWGGYLLQERLSDGRSIVYSGATVFQDRNWHDVTQDFKDEVIGYENTYKIPRCGVLALLPEKTKTAFNYYNKVMRAIIE